MKKKKTYRNFFVGNKYLYSLRLIKDYPSPKFDEVGHVTHYREGGLIPSLVNVNERITDYWEVQEELNGQILGLYSCSDII